eukprot:scaffold13160_cov106-Isochrysis_galbana.AAC.1
MSEHATDSLRFMPPESAWARACALSVSPTLCTIAMASRRTAARGTPLSAAYVSTCSSTVRVCHSTSCCGQMPIISYTRPAALRMEWPKT